MEYQENFASKGSCTWYCLVGNSKKWKEGKLTRTLTIDHSTLTITAERIRTHGTSQEIRFEWRMDPPLPSLKGREKVSPLRGDLEGSLTFAEIIDAVGELPIPPYLNRKTEESDKTTYQTV